MNHRERLAIIGSGASAIYLLKHLLDDIDRLKHRLGEISIFEKSAHTGMGMPYSPETTDRCNMSNISSEELPELPMTFGDWLRAQDAALLESLGVETKVISDSEVYPRLALGRYLQAQYQTLLAKLREAGIVVHEHPGEVTDVRDEGATGHLTLITGSGKSRNFERLVIATGHHWPGEDRPASGYFASPWPIFKLLPEKGKLHNFVIGVLGASLSAFDVISSLAHRHGTFAQGESGEMIYRSHPGTEEFKMVMHSARGLLPHLQFDQVEPLREIYRHVTREEILALLDEDDFLRLETYFDKVCRPALIAAFKKDEMPDVVKSLADPVFRLADFVETMSDKHDYADAFEGMRIEMVEARDSVLNHKPIHWKEVVDDLMYTLNFHAELLPAEDHLFLHSTVMPFLMNVIAAMPLPSGNILLALHAAGKLEIVSGKVTIPDEQKAKRATTITVEDEDGKESTLTYRMFIDCGGQKPLELEDYPFASLVNNEKVRKARAAFTGPEAAAKAVPEEKRADLFKEGPDWFWPLSGIDIDATYRLIGSDGTPHAYVHDIAFPHTSGLRPYSYGLQACSHTAAIVVKSWVEDFNATTPVPPDIAEVTRIYEEV